MVPPILPSPFMVQMPPIVAVQPRDCQPGPHAEGRHSWRVRTGSSGFRCKRVGPASRAGQDQPDFQRPARLAGPTVDFVLHLKPEEPERLLSGTGKAGKKRAAGPSLRTDRRVVRHLR